MIFPIFALELLCDISSGFFFQELLRDISDLPSSYSAILLIFALGLPMPMIYNYSY